MTTEARESIRETVIATLRTAAGWLREHDELMLHEVADAVEHQAPADWTRCPVCDEIECDGGCPLAPLRKSDDRTSLNPEEIT